MVLVGFFCVVGAVGLLVVGLVQSDPDLVWASIGASAIGGLAVAVASIQRSRALRRVRGSAATASGSPAPGKPAAARQPVTDKPVAKEPTAEEPVSETPAVKEPVVAEEGPAKEAPAKEASAKEASAESLVDEKSVTEEPAAEGGAAADSGEPAIDQADAGEAVDPKDEPAEEDVDMADLLVVIDLSDEVLVVDLRPRYHRAGCAHLVDRDALPLPVSEAREDGFTPCGLCQPDAALAAAARQARHSSPDRPAKPRPRPGL